MHSQVFDFYHRAKQTKKYFANAIGFGHQDAEFAPPAGGHWNGFVGTIVLYYTQLGLARSSWESGG